MTMRIFLIRHGESEYNCYGRYTGQRDVPLSALGRRQAQQLARRLESEPLAVIYSSPLQRARETAEAIAQVRGISLHLEAFLAEIDHGLWEGLTAIEVAAKFPAEFAQWQTHPHLCVMPQGESLQQVALRAEEAFQRIVAEYHHGTVAICSHDAVLRVLLLQALGVPLEHFWKVYLENASLSLLEAHAGAAHFRLALFNDTAHLQSVRSDYKRQAL